MCSRFARRRNLRRVLPITPYPLAVPVGTPLSPLADVLTAAGGLIDVAQARYAWNPAAGSPAESERYEAQAHQMPDEAMLDLLRTVGDYVGAAAAHLRGLGVLVQADERYTLPLVGRSVVEHAQRALWLLETTHGNTGIEADRITARQRAARAQIENLFSARHYRDTIGKLLGSSEALDEARRKYKERKATTLMWFPEATLHGPPGQWTVDDQRYVGPTAMSEWYFGTMGVGVTVDGIYDALSGWSHPTVWGIRDCQTVREGPNGGVLISWLRDDSFVERVCFNVLTTSYRMFRQLHSYYGWDDTNLLDWADSINIALPGAIVP